MVGVPGAGTGVGNGARWGVVNGFTIVGVNNGVATLDDTVIWTGLDFVSSSADDDEAPAVCSV